MSKQTKANLLAGKMDSARNMLIQICGYLDQKQILYHLEGGTLLGLVRDGDLLPWDGDLDISIPSGQVDAFIKLRAAFLLMGYKISVRRSSLENGPIKAGQVSVIKVKSIWGYWLKALFPKFKLVVLDVFIKTSDTAHTYWQANGKVMRVKNVHYSSFETITFRHAELKVPNQYRDYLTEKYGDWSIPVKEWDCSVNEKTIVN